MCRISQIWGQGLNSCSILKWAEYRAQSFGVSPPYAHEGFVPAQVVHQSRTSSSGDDTVHDEVLQDTLELPPLAAEFTRYEQGWWVNVNTLLLDYTQDTGPTLTPNPLLTRSNTSPETGVNPVLTRC